MTAKAVMARALYDFTGDPAVRQLTFKKNDLIKVTHQYENGWWAGELNGKAGYLPSTYIKIEDSIAPPGRTTGPAPPSPKPAPPPAGGAPSPASKPSPQPASKPPPGGGLATISVTGGAAPVPTAKPKPPPPRGDSGALNRSQGTPAPPNKPLPQNPPTPARVPPSNQPQPAVNLAKVTPPAPGGRAPPSTNNAPATAPRPSVGMQQASKGGGGGGSGWANAAAPGSDVNEADFSELDSLIKSLQDEVLDLKKLL